MEAFRMKICFLFLLFTIIEATIFRLERISSPIIDFSVFQTNILPIYSTRIKLGYPPQDFTVVIDTGSDLTWVACKSCNTTCPEGIFHQYNTSFSTSARLVSCPHKWCKCSEDHLCQFDINYEDQSTTSGYYVEDWFWLDANVSWTPLIFGCSTYQSGSLAVEGKGFDGILGFGRGPFSLPSQLRINAFSHCFNTYNKDGFLLLGEALLPNLVYTPMVPKTSHFNLYLEKIMVNGQTLPIDPTVFKSSEEGAGTVIDSGTAYMLLIEKAYDELITTVNSFLPPTVKRQTHDQRDCYVVTSIEAFPVITLVFAQNATLVLHPQQYLRQSDFTIVDSIVPRTWCIGIVRWPGITILGDFVLQNKLLVYDIARQRVGWADFDCSISDKELPVNLSLITRHNNLARRIYITYKYVICILSLSFVILFL